MNGLLDFLQGASNAAASNVTAPVDLINWLLQKVGLPVSQAPVGGSAWAEQKGLTKKPQNALLGMGGETAGLLSPVVAAAKAPQIAKGLLQMGENAAAPRTVNAGMAAGQRGVVGYDPRFDPRVKEAEKLQRLAPIVEPRSMQSVPALSLADLEGMPFITSMSDRTAAGGLLTGINDVKFSRPVDLRGGQDFMFDNPGQVWASAPGPVKQILGLAQDVKRVTGKDPLYLPWRMAPSGGDFAAMTGETMLSYAKESLGKRDTQKLDKAIKQYILDWKGVADDASVEQFRSASDVTRKALKNMMDTQFRERGGLGIGEARLAIADPKQIAGQDGQIMNVGRIFSGRGAIQDSTHPSYPRGVPGEGVGRIAETRNIFELLPDVVSARGIPSSAQPRQTDLRALQMKPYAGVISDSLLKSLGY